MSENKSFEEVLAEIETIISKLGKEDVKLEESVELYKKGRILLTEAKGILIKNEQIVAQVMNEHIKNN